MCSRRLTDQDLKDLGVSSLGHSKKLLQAIATPPPNSRHRLLTEARDVIARGNNIAALFMLGAIVWWFATLFPFDLSEGAIGTPIKRLGNDLPLLIQKAEASCRTTLDKYNHALREGTFEHCAPSSRAGILSSGKAQLLRRRSSSLSIRY